jgi:hypothetical protein
MPQMILTILITALALRPAMAAEPGQPAPTVFAAVNPQPAGTHHTGPQQTGPQHTGKERLSDKASDEQRVDDCKVPEARRSRPRSPHCPWEVGS